MVAVDASPEMQCYTRERLDREGLFGVETRLEQLPAGPEPEGGFDGALAIVVLNYVRDIEGALKMLVSSLKAGGWAVFNVPARSAGVGSMPSLSSSTGGGSTSTPSPR